MKIRKLYRIESAHIVKNAVSRRCSMNIHGHSGVIEVFLKSAFLDNAGMVYDFGAFKDTIGSFIDMFDHSVHIFSEDKGRLDFFKATNERYIILPFNPTAENYCLFFKEAVNQILEASDFNNGELNVSCCGVRYHETSTGYAESDEEDYCNYNIQDLEFSPRTLEEASSRLKEILSIINQKRKK
jgi:6-pyruvoyltetrahydropterin/6-carboxytetrahydropterin synthase